MREKRAKNQRLILEIGNSASDTEDKSTTEDCDFQQFTLEMEFPMQIPEMDIFGLSSPYWK